MTANSNAKKLVRARMAATGEKYTQALRAITTANTAEHGTDPGAIHPRHLCPVCGDGAAT